MSFYRERLPQLSGGLFLTDGGLETTLVFHDGMDLPEFAAFTLLDHDEGRTRLSRYFQSYIDIAVRQGTGFILESCTWRASYDWGRKIGYSPEQVDLCNRRAIELLKELRSRADNAGVTMVISGCMGPRGDGYVSDNMMSRGEAEEYHRPQVQVLADSDADMVSAFTMNYSSEAVGLTRAAQSVGIPVVISFTLETDGSLPSGESLEEAISAVDIATDHGPAYYMINCAHPSHFKHLFSNGRGWLERIGGMRANASALSHTELDQAEELDDGNPEELGESYAELLRRLPRLNVLGGCCGTDTRHIEAISRACEKRFNGNGGEA
ncbi:MAG: homocysteine S-methyltransferase [Desulfuromonas sp.]|nr:MAG: homocysteine S-methyltransferase [Desulfuromonas sp.]